MSKKPPTGLVPENVDIKKVITSKILEGKMEEVWAMVVAQSSSKPIVRLKLIINSRFTQHKVKEIFVSVVRVRKRACSDRFNVYHFSIMCHYCLML